MELSAEVGDRKGSWQRLWQHLTMAWGWRGSRGKNKPWEIPEELGGRWGGGCAADRGDAAVAESAPEHARRGRERSLASPLSTALVPTHPEANWQENTQILPESHSRFRARQRRAESERAPTSAHVDGTGGGGVPTAKERQHVAAI